MFQKYIDINSARRNRAEYPETNEFVVRFGHQESKSDRHSRGLIYHGSVYGQTQKVYYQIKLIDLVLPNAVIVNDSEYNGHKITDIPYFYLEFNNVNNSSSIIYSNSPESRKAIFKVTFNGSNVVHNGSNTAWATSKFVHLTCDMVQTIKFKPNADHFFKLTLPDGNLVRFAMTDTIPVSEPLEIVPPNPDIQTSATFCIKQMQ